MSGPLAISLTDVQSAADQIRGVAIRTPLIESAPLSDVTGARTLIKFEGAQHTGSFKFRGAYNHLSRIGGPAKAAGVVAWSSGNHAQGIAAAAKLLGMRATIVMPSDAPAIKMANTRALGAEIVPYDRLTESREEIATRLATERGATLVPSFDDPFIIAGQGTAGLEILEQSRDLGAAIDRVLVCCGGGGFVAGIAMAIRSQAPEVSVFSVEPSAFDDTARSLASGRREQVPAGAKSICDALLSPMPGELTFPINQALLAGGLSVSDDEVRAAMRFAFDKLKLVVEPGGAVALAAALNKRMPAGEGALVVVMSGANVDPDAYAKILAG